MVPTARGVLWIGCGIALANALCAASPTRALDPQSAGIEELVVDVDAEVNPRPPRPQPRATSTPGGTPARLEIVADGSFLLDGRRIASTEDLYREAHQAPELTGDRHVVIALPPGVPPSRVLAALRELKMIEPFFDPPRWTGIVLELPPARAGEGALEVPGHTAIVFVDASGVHVAGPDERPSPVPGAEDVLSFAAYVLQGEPEASFLVVIDPGADKALNPPLIAALRRAGVSTATWIDEHGARVRRFN